MDFSKFLHTCSRGDAHTVRSVLSTMEASDRQQWLRQANEGGVTALMAAACDGSLDLIQSLLPESDVTRCDIHGRTALMSAAWYGNTAIVVALVGAGSDVHAVDCNGKTALNLATFKAGAQTIRALVDAGSDVARSDESGISPLMVAACNGTIEIVRLLLPGSDLMAIDREGRTALLFAASRNHTETVRLLLAGSDVGHRDNKGRTAFDLVMMLSERWGFNDYKGCLDLLVDANALRQGVAWPEGATANDLPRWHAHLEKQKLLVAIPLARHVPPQIQHRL